MGFDLVEYLDCLPCPSQALIVNVFSPTVPSGKGPPRALSSMTTQGYAGRQHKLEPGLADGSAEEVHKGRSHRSKLHQQKLRQGVGLSETLSGTDAGGW